jgi:hypothetical protein
VEEEVVEEEVEEEVENKDGGCIKRVCEVCEEDKVLNEYNFTKFGYGFKKTCVRCDLSRCEIKMETKVEVNTEIKDGMDTCKCSMCKEILSILDFYKNSATKSGHESACKNCSAKRKNMARNRGVLKPMKIIKDKPVVNIGEKFCVMCDTVKDIDNFRVAKKRKDGLQCYCRDCDNERTRKNRMKRKIKNKIEGIGGGME